MSPRLVAWLAGAVVTVTIALSLVLPGERAVLVSGAALVLLAGATVTAVVSAWRARPAHTSPFDSLERAAPAPARPDDLVRLERMFGWKAYSRAEFAATVAPVLGSIVAARLRDTFGVDPATEPERARSLLAPELWGLVDRSRLDTVGPSVTTRDIDHLVELIEDL